LVAVEIALDPPRDVQTRRERGSPLALGAVVQANLVVEDENDRRDNAERPMIAHGVIAGRHHVCFSTVEGRDPPHHLAPEVQPEGPAQMATVQVTPAMAEDSLPTMDWQRLDATPDEEIAAAADVAPLAYLRVIEREPESVRRALAA
jgi:hypothetical protein